MLAWSQLNDDERAHLKNHPEQEELVLGPEVPLDSAQRYVMEEFLERRAQSSPDQGIALVGVDPVLKILLTTMDQVFRSERGSRQEEMDDIEPPEGRSKRG